MTDLERSWADEPHTRSLPHHPGRTTTMKHFTKSRVLTVAAASGAAVALAGGVAYAVWTATGTGSGTAKASGFSLPGVDVNATGTPANALYPGGTSDLMVMASNNNPFPVTITLTANSGAKITSDKANCNETVNGASTVTGVTLASGTVTVPANTTTAIARSVSNAVSMAAGSSSNCIGATFTIPLNVSASPS